MKPQASEPILLLLYILSKLFLVWHAPVTYGTALSATR